MKSNVVQHQTDISADIKLSDGIIKLCQRGDEFYTHAISLVDDYKLQRILRGQSTAYKRMLIRLTSQQGSTSADNTSNKLLNPYMEVEALLEQQAISLAISALIKLEQQVLAQVKHAVKQARHPHLTCQLAEGAAWLQISCDAMQSLHTP
ncbi:hypothetical protein L2744_02350 [Shewanella profunda]|uniref:hypothetical protein n=1 Tax=Shewanella profunda TaxID=254793 RepID=UPI002010C493|nr:hypothetical protein [Shewanella profunda]MCL1088469.1 hypothetical protein [Shewanella profunda]